MLVKPSFSTGGETRLSFTQDLLGQSIEPFPSLIVHGHLRTLTGDRTAVAATLLLGRAITASLKVGRPISHRVASQVRKYTELEGLDIPETTTVPLAVHTGSVELVVCSDHEELPVLVHSERRRMALKEVPSHQYAGRLFSFESVVVATNSWLFGEGSLIKNGNGHFEASLAVPVLLAQDLSASRITVSKPMVANVPPARLEALKQLLLSTDIQLKIQG